MDLIFKARKHENLHIVFWLIKDSCWMLELRWLGTAMVIPALLTALYIIHLTRGLREIYINIAVFFWILANSYWMVCEFFFDNRYKDLAGIPFGLGFVFVGLFYYRNHADSKGNRP